MKMLWLGVLIGPVIWYVSIRVLYFIFVQQGRAIRKWYVGLPVIQWPAMILIVLGSKFVRTGNCKWMRYENRIWFSPMVKGFEVEE